MKKTTKTWALVIALVMVFATMTVLLTACTHDDDQDFDGGTFNITVWVSEVDGVKELTEKQIARFNETNGKYTFNATVEGISESDSATKMITSVADGADIFCFAQDQTARLVEAKALSQPGSTASEVISKENDAGAVKAVQVAGKYRAYPLTSDNGYFMYYDKRVIKDSDLGDLAKLVAACEAAGKNFSMEVGTSAWYLASFFFGTGCHSNWTTDAKGKINGVDDDFNRDAGMIAMKGMQILTKSSAHVSSSAVSDFAATTPSAIVVSGAWAYSDVKDILGDNLGAAPLPSFTVDGKSYHMGSFSGNKLLGVRPTTDLNKAAGLSLLARYLTGEECQLERFEQFGWGPSNLKAQSSKAVKEAPHLVALAKQNAYGTPQGNIHGSWWDIAKILGDESKAATTDAELKAALEAYDAAIHAVLNKSDDEERAWSVIGSVNGTNWDTDFAMEEGPDNTWTSKDTFALTSTSEFKVRMGASWTVNIGGDGNLNGDNATLALWELPEGNYKVQVVVNYDGDNVTGGTITLIPA